jgi:hypothetical protein
MSTGARCDFCSAQPVIASYPAEDVTLAFTEGGAPIFRSTGDWCACDTCDEYIRHNKWLALEDRALESLRLRMPDMDADVLVSWVRVAQAAFRAMRLGRG